jgi:hypothetical protein
MGLQKDNMVHLQTEKLGDARSSDMDRGDVSEILEKHKINNGSGILDSRNCVDESHIWGTKMFRKKQHVSCSN